MFQQFSCRETLVDERDMLMGEVIYQARSASKVMLAFGLVWVLFSLIFVPLGIRLINQERRFDAEGITAPGIITSKRVAEKREQDRETKRERISRTYYVTYRFTSDQGREIEGEISVSKERWERAVERESIQVQYLPHDAAKSRIAGDSDKTKSLLFTGIGAFGGLVGLVCIATYIRRTVTITKRKADSPR